MDLRVDLFGDLFVDIFVYVFVVFLWVFLGCLFVYMLVDKKITGDQAYLVLTVPEKEVTPVIPDPKTTRDSVNRAFDEGVPMNLRKYRRVAEGERLRLVKERLTTGISRSSPKEKLIDDELPDEGEEKPTKPDVSKKKPRVIIQEQDVDDLI